MLDSMGHARDESGGERGASRGLQGFEDEYDAFEAKVKRTVTKGLARPMMMRPL